MIESKSDSNKGNNTSINDNKIKGHGSPAGYGWIRHIPNMFTLLNLFFGCIAIVFTLQTESVIIYVNDQYQSSFNIPEKLTLAAIFIGLAAIIDFLDGFVARLLQATSYLGKQLDSLSDIISFGVAPAAIIYQLLRLSFAREENGLEISVLWLLPAFLISCAAAYRLAKFNIDEKQEYNFTGMPTPVTGLLIASFPLILHYNATLFEVGSILINKWVLYATIVFVSYLMLSKIPMMGMKFKDYSVKNNLPKFILLGTGLVSVILLQWVAVPLIFLLYILLSLVYKKTLT